MTFDEFLHPWLRDRLAALDSNPEVAAAEIGQLRDEILERAANKQDELLDELSKARDAGDDNRMQEIVRLLSKVSVPKE